MSDFDACRAAVRQAAGRDLSDAEADFILGAVHDRAAGMEMRAGRLPDAARALGDEARMAAAIERRNLLENRVKHAELMSEASAAPSTKLLGRETSGPVMGLESAMVGVNTPWQGSRQSVVALVKGAKRVLAGGLVKDLEDAGLLGAARRGDLDRLWARELFELSKGENGNPGVTGSREARELAEIVHRYQRLAVDMQNDAGGWVGGYDGYITRTSHDPDRIRRAGYDQWRTDILPALDRDRTFAGVADPERFLKGVYDGLVTGVHLTQEGAQGFKDAAFAGPGNLAKRLSQDRVLHFQDAEGWLDYHDRYGRGTLMEEVVRGMEVAAQNSALMQKFGTNPRSMLDQVVAGLKERYRDQYDVVDNIKSREHQLQAFMDQLDGTAHRPVDRALANVMWWTRWQQQMSKLGSMVFSHFGLLMNHAAELRYQGVGLGEGYWNAMASLFPHGVDEHAADLLRAGWEGTASDLLARLHPETDGAPGVAAKLANIFFKASGMHYVVEHMRTGAEVMMARHLGRLLDSRFAELPEESRRLLGMYGLDSGHWDMLRSVPDIYRDGEGRAFLTPDVAGRVDDAAMAAHLDAGGHQAGDEAVARAKRDLAVAVAGMYADRADFVTNTADARELAMMYGRSKRGELFGEALRAFWQFKSFPFTAMTKSVGREIYGQQALSSQIGGLVHMAVMGTLLGMLANAAKDVAHNKTPRAWNDPATILAGFLKGGGGGLLGDFLFGEANRFGMSSVVASEAGPLFGTLDQLFGIKDRLFEGKDVAASVFRLARDNAPFVNLFYVRRALDQMFLWQWEEAMNPGFLRRWERRVKQQTGQTFLVSPAAVARGQ